MRDQSSHGCMVFSLPIYLTASRHTTWHTRYLLLISAHAVVTV